MKAMTKGLTQAILEAVQRGPVSVSQLSRVLLRQKRAVSTILKRLEARGLIYRRTYRYRAPGGITGEYKPYFPAGMADGQPLPGFDLAPDLPTRAALHTLERDYENMILAIEAARGFSPRGHCHVQTCSIRACTASSVVHPEEKLSRFNSSIRPHGIFTFTAHNLPRALPNARYFVARWT